MSRLLIRAISALVALTLVGNVGVTPPPASGRPMAPRVDTSERDSSLRAAPRRHTITATFTGDTEGLRLIVVTATGRTVGSARLTSNPTAVRVRTAPITSLRGVTLQLVNDRSTSSAAARARSGDYLGPVVLGWKGTQRTSASTVYTKFAASTSRSVALGKVKVEKITAKQGFAYTVKNDLGRSIDTRSGQGAAARKGVPLGVGTYGRRATARTSEAGESSSIRVGEGPSADDTLGGDRDDDGIPNAFDVDDDGDGTTDSADGTTPTQVVVPEDLDTGALCAPESLRIFTNLKATQPRFAGSINSYAPGDFTATRARSAAIVTSTMSMVIAPIDDVCGERAIRTELKGIGVPYAPADYQELAGTCATGDYQWSIGAGEMCAGDPSRRFDFGSGYTFTATDLPSGQDVFSMRVTTDAGNSYEFVSTAGFVFVTHPMLTEFAVTDDGRTPAADDWVAIDYDTTMTTPDGVGVVTEPTIAVAEQQDVWLRVLRPQRLAIDGEASDSGFVDLGGFRYTPDIPNGASPGNGPGRCDALSHTDEQLPSDKPTRSITEPRVLELRWDLSECYGVAPRFAPWQPGPTDFDIQVEPSGPGGNSAQKVRLTYV